MPGVRVDGNDVFAVSAATRERARPRAPRRRADADRGRHLPGGRAHSSDDPSRYRDDEVAEWEKREPLLRFRPGSSAEILDAAGVAAMERELDDEIQAAIAAEEAAPRPRCRRSSRTCSAKVPAALAEQLAELESAWFLAVRSGRHGTTSERGQTVRSWHQRR